MRKSSFWVASHLTGFFEIIDSDDLALRGSRGAGFNLNRGSVTSISNSNGSEAEIYFNGEKMNFNEAVVTREVVDLFFKKSKLDEIPLVITHQFNVPMSAGFGASAGGALGTAFCLNDIFKTAYSRQELFEMAHVAETKHWCGLGDVLGLYRDSGTEIRVKPGTPGIGITKSFAIDPGTRIFTCSFGKLHTAEVLTDPVYRQKIIKKGREEIEKVIKEPHVELFMNSCRSFSNFVGLYSKKAKQAIKAFKDRELETPTMIMLGDGLFIMTKDERTLEYLNSTEKPFNLFIEEELAERTVKKVNKNA